MPLTLASAYRFFTADGTKHLGVSVTLCPGRAEGASLPQVPSDYPWTMDLWGHMPQPLLVLPSEHRCSCLNRTHFQDDSWGGCGWGASPTPKARLGCNLLALLALGFGVFPPTGASPGLLSGGIVPVVTPAVFPLVPSGVFLPNLLLLREVREVRQEGGNLPGQPSVFMRCFTSCSHRPWLQGPQVE